MFKILKLAALDILKNKIIFSIIIIWLFALSWIFTSVVLSILPNEDEKSAVQQQIYFSQDNINFAEVINVFETVSYHSYAYYNGIDNPNVPIIILFGDYKNGKTIGFDKNLNTTIIFNKQRYPITIMEKSEFITKYDEEILSADILIDMDDNLIKNVEEAQFFSGITIQKAEYEKIKNKLMDLGVNFVFFEKNSASAVFIEKYMSVLIISIIVALISSMTMMNEYFMTKRLVDYRIHLLYGARLYQIFLRNFYYYFILVTIELGIAFVFGLGRYLLVLVIFSLFVVGLSSVLYIINTVQLLKKYHNNQMKVRSTC